MTEKCDICGAEKVLRPAGKSKKPPYKEYDAFYSCPNYKSHPKKDGWENSEGTSSARIRTTEPNGFQILADEILGFRKHFDERMDGLSRFLTEKLK